MVVCVFFSTFAPDSRSRVPLSAPQKSLKGETAAGLKRNMGVTFDSDKESFVFDFEHDGNHARPTEGAGVDTQTTIPALCSAPYSES